MSRTKSVIWQYFTENAVVKSRATCTLCNENVNNVVAWGVGCVSPEWSGTTHRLTSCVVVLQCCSLSIASSRSQPLPQCAT